MKRYEPHTIEPKWQAAWEKSGIFKTPDKPKHKAYVLGMFPYPSGDGLHLGHVKSYTPSDAYSHFMRFTGKDVLHPMGWDAFGLPAENAAIKKGTHPAKNTAANIKNFRRQLKSIGYSFDWDREVDTSDPDYYRWTQWIFLQLFKKGLAYQGTGWQWWCPEDKTVLANEQVIDGRCERCDSEVTKKQLEQWYFKITDYADELLEGLEDLDWPEKIKTMQRNWIGKSEGAEVTFATPVGKLKVYTTRPDTLFGATYMVLAPEHELVAKLTKPDQKQAVEAYVKRAKTESDIARTATDKEKTGVFTGSYAKNPVNGEEIPIWIADYVLLGYGTGAIMAVPAHDQRDFEFAKKFDLPIRQVVEPTFGEPAKDEVEKQAIIVALRNPKSGEVLVLDWGPRKERHGGTMLIGGGVESGEDVVTAATREIAEETGYTDIKLVRQLETQGHGHFFSNVKNKNYLAHCTGLLFELQSNRQEAINLDDGEHGKFKVRWMMADKIADVLDDGIHEAIYRQLVLDECYGGEGVMINSGKYDGLDSAKARDKITADLKKQKLAKEQAGYKLRDWLISRQRYWGTPIPIIHCPKCGAQAVPEKDLPVELPDVKDYLPTGDGRSPLAKVKSFVETKCPKCKGKAERETDTMDTFADSSWYFLRYPTPNLKDKPFDAAALKTWLPVDTYVGGAEHAVLHLLYARFWTKVLADAGHLQFREPFASLRNQGLILAPDGQKMSKSKGNVINPDEIVGAVGADTMRTYVLFMGPFEQSAGWNKSDMEGSYRFLKRVWTFGQDVSKTAKDNETTRRALQQGIRNVTRSLEHFRFNTAISSLMETLNTFYAEPKAVSQDTFRSYLILLAPFAPHLAEELWQQLGGKDSIFTQRWPELDESALKQESVTIVVQVSGKVRANLTVSAGEVTEESVTKAALADENVKKHLGGATPKKVIYVEGKLLNFVV